MDVERKWVDEGLGWWEVNALKTYEEFAVVSLWLWWWLLLQLLLLLFMVVVVVVVVVYGRNAGF